MKEPKNGFYPYPILKYKDNGSYNSSILLKAEYINMNVDDDNNINLDVVIDMDECYLRHLVEEKKARIFLSISQNTYRTQQSISDFGQSHVEISTKSMTRGYNVELLPLIVAMTDFEMEYVPGEMNEDYMYLNPPFEIKKGNILGFGQPYSFKLCSDNAMSDIIQIQMVSGDKVPPIKIDVEGDQIVIQVNEEMDKRIERMRSDSCYDSSLALLSCSLAYPAFQIALSKLLTREGFNRYKGKLWAQAFQNKINEKLGTSIEDILLDLDPENVPETALEYTQLILDGYFILSLDKAIGDKGDN